MGARRAAAAAPARSPAPRPAALPSQLADLLDIMPHLSNPDAAAILASVDGDVEAAVAVAAEARPPPAARSAARAPRPATPASPRPLSRPPPPSRSDPRAARGHKPLLGRTVRCGSKAVALISIGALNPAPGWHNAGYIFPAGYAAVTKFRGSVDIAGQVDHECRVVGAGGAHWPAPTFVIVAADRPDEPLAARSATGAWAAVLARIGSVIEARRAAGEALAPPPRTQIAGPEYYGLTHPTVAPMIEELDPGRLCTAYWAGKESREAYVATHGDRRRPRAAPVGRARDRDRKRDRRRDGPRAAPAPAVAAAAAAAGAATAAAAGLPPTLAVFAPPASPPTPALAADGSRKRVRVRTERDRERERARRARERALRAADADGDRAGSPCESEDDMRGVPGPWSGLGRGERASRRAGLAAAADGDGNDAAPPPAHPSPPPLLPGAVDAITLDPVVDPAACPDGHVLGWATWRAVLAESGRCPFSATPLSRHRLTRLTPANIDKWRPRLKLVER
jgi:hypothetical protein